MGEASQPYLAAARPHPGVGTGSILAVAAEARTYRNLAYLLLALPLGLAYFAFLAAGFALGTGLFVTLISPPILLAVVAGSWRLADVERRLAGDLLGEPIPPAFVGFAPMPAMRVWLRTAVRDRNALGALGNLIAARLVDPITFRGLAFLVAKLPLGLLSLAAVTASYGLALSLLLAPLTYRVDALAARFGPVRVDSMEEAALAFLVAPGAILAAMHASNALAAASGRFAHLMLTSPDSSGTSGPPGEGAARR